MKIALPRLFRLRNLCRGCSPAQVNTPTLNFPGRTLQSSGTAIFALKACYAASSDASLCGVAPVSFAVTASPLQLRVAGGNAIVGASATLRLDASASSDPDDESGGMSFSWACAPPPELATGGSGSGCTDSVTGGPLVLARAPVVKFRVPVRMFCFFQLTSA